MPDLPSTHRWWQREYRIPCATLLIVQLAGLLLYPFVEHSALGTSIIGVFSVFVLCVTIAIVHRTAGNAWISLLIAVPVVALNLARILTQGAALVPWAAGLESLFYFYAAVSLIRYMLGDARATKDELYGAGATFTLLAWAYAYLFMLCESLQPGAFSSATHPGAPHDWIELIYLSFVLLSSTGIGDIAPMTPHARALASLEMFTGVMYLALVVSRLVGLTLVRRAP